MKFEEIAARLKKRKSRTKGHDFERWVAGQLRPVFPEARRHLEYQAGEANGVDISNTGLYKIQCKREKKYASITAIEEVQHKPELGDVPVLITAGDDKTPMAVIPFEEFIRLVKIEIDNG